MPKIDDDELRELFQTECEEHLQTLDDGLLRLETSPSDKSTLEEVFRAAHSLKGTARMLGVSGVETIAHHMEDELGSVRRGRAALSSSHIDRYSVGLSAMRILVHEAVSGQVADVDVSRVLAQLSGEIPLEIAPATVSVEADAIESAPVEVAPVAALVEAQVVEVAPGELEVIEVAPDEARLVEAAPMEAQEVQIAPVATPIEAAPVAVVVQTMPVEVAPAEVARVETSAMFETSATFAAAPMPVFAPVTAPVVLPPLETRVELATSASESESAVEVADDARRDEFKIQTMRVPPAKLDALMTLASELTVTTTRVVRGITVFEEIGALCEEWSKESGQRRFSPTSGARDDAAKTLATLQARDQVRLARLTTLWKQLQQTTYQDVTRLNFVADELEEGIRGVRLLPLSQIFNLFPRLVRDLARELGKEVNFTIEGGETTADKRILEELKDPLMHMIRNAVDHGIESPQERERSGKARAATLRLRASQTANNVLVELRDDGRGLNIEAIKSVALKRHLHTQDELEAMSREQLQLLIFAPGFSTSALVTDVSGRGVGMDVVRINIERLKGTIRVESETGGGTTFGIRLPSTLATTRVLLVTVNGRVYAIPVEWVQTIVRVSREQIFSIEGRKTVVLDGRALPLVPLSSLLELPSRAAKDAEITVILGVGDERFGVEVDGLVDEQEVMLKPLGALLKRVRHVSGVTILGAGEICMVLSVQDMARTALQGASRPMAPPVELQLSENAPRKVILLAEDSITTRTQEKRILESAGFEVVTAVDGADAFAKLSTRDFDALVSDVEMPNLDGLSLAARIRENPRFDEMPIILVTSLASDDDKRRGIEVGANAYIAKGTFEQKVLVDTVRRLV